MTFCERTTILLDCHPDTQSPCVPELEDSLVPPCPLWSCFVEATLEYCRVVFDLFDTDSNRRPVSVHIAGVPLERSILNTWQDQNLKQIADNFTGISPASVSPSPARLSHALESSLKALNQSESDEKFNARFVLILMGKGDEQQFGYQETRSHKLIDIRDVIRGILAQHEDLFKVKFRHLKRCHFDILRVLPSYEPISEDIPWTKIHVENLSTEFSATVYNILPGRKYLTRSMLHLVQLHHHLHTLRLLEVPMKKSDNTKTTYEIELLYQANNHKPGNISVTTEHSSRPRLFEPSYFKDRQTVVKWVKQKLYSLEGTVTRCSHMVTPIDISVPTRVLITSLSKGAIYALTDPSLSNNQSTPRNENSPPIKPLFSHILIFREGALYVHCQHINHGKNAHLLDVINFEAPPQLVTSPKSDISMYSQFFEPFIIKPNLVLANRRPISKTIKVSGYEVESTQNLDIETRWLKTALSSNNDIILKLQSNLSEGGNLVHGILTELKNLLCVETPPDDYTKIANNILDRLFALGRGSDSFPNQKNAVALLKLIPEISEAFQSTSTEHAEIHEIMTGRVRPDGTENKPLPIIQSSDLQNTSSNLTTDIILNPKEETKETQVAWKQLDQYSSMTYKEQQDMDGPEATVLSQPISMRARGQHYRVRGGYGGRRPQRGFSDFGRSQTPDFDDNRNSGPIPYLQYNVPNIFGIKKEQEKYMSRLGKSNSLLYQYWIGKRNARESRGIKRKDFDGQLPIEPDEKLEQ